ncbi:hypothetical protein O980_24470 [Mycobacterium avium subsp. paratuberculosis 08-8281]|nr:hypothetical protein O980_24470 [Mycobacterium avium subsp. paratuberculosis 08-8281]
MIHAMHEEQDMRRYGGLRAALPVTFVTFGFGVLKGPQISGGNFPPGKIFWV